MGSPMVRRAKGVDWAGAGTEGAPTCEDAMRSKFWDECIIALLNLIYLECPKALRNMAAPGLGSSQWWGFSPALDLAAVYDGKMLTNG